MKKALLLLSLTGAVTVLAGCQDEQVVEPTASAEQVVVETEITAPENDATETELATIDEHTANNALDWNGTYFGTLPCADCEGIETQVTLNHDGSYSVNQTYLGKEDGVFQSHGQLSWNDKGTIITLENESGANQYFVGENVLFKLDMNGKRVEGDLAEHYQLQKQ
tara:strand:- start:781 stop:1278 length:498 start_codon:yes stop_codon:yes gene_type:complete